MGQDQINRYNMYQTAAITCNVAPGFSSGEGIQQMEELVSEQLGGEYGYEWTSVAYQETQAGNTTTIVFLMALLVAFLVLAAQYESWTSPVAAIMGITRSTPWSDDWLLCHGHTGKYLYPDWYYPAYCTLSQKWYSNCRIRPRLPGRRKLHQRCCL